MQLCVSAHASQMVSCQANNANAIKAAYHVAAVEQSDQQKLRRLLSEGTVGVMNTNISVGSAGARRGGGKAKNTRLE